MGNPFAVTSSTPAWQIPILETLTRALNGELPGGNDSWPGDPWLQAKVIAGQPTMAFLQLANGVDPITGRTAQVTQIVMSKGWVWVGDGTIQPRGGGTPIARWDTPTFDIAAANALPIEPSTGGAGTPTNPEDQTAYHEPTPAIQQGAAPIPDNGAQIQRTDDPRIGGVKNETVVSLIPSTKAVEQLTAQIEPVIPIRVPTAALVDLAPGIQEAYNPQVIPQETAGNGIGIMLQRVPWWGWLAVGAIGLYLISKSAK